MNTLQLTFQLFLIVGGVLAFAGYVGNVFYDALRRKGNQG